MRTLFYLSFLVFLVGSCSDDPIEEELKSSYHEKKELLVGEWNIYEEYRVYRADSIFIETIHNLDLIFFADGLGERQTYINGDLEPFEWLFQSNPDVVVIKSLVEPSTLFLNVEENDGLNQVWKSITYFPYGPLYDPDDLQPIIHDWTLTKK